MINRTEKRINVVAFVVTIAALMLFACECFGQRAATITDLRLRRDAGAANQFSFRHAGNGIITAYNAAGAVTSTWNAETGVIDATISGAAESVAAANVTAGTFQAGVLLPAANVTGDFPISKITNLQTTLNNKANLTGTNAESFAINAAQIGPVSQIGFYGNTESLEHEAGPGYSRFSFSGDVEAPAFYGSGSNLTTLNASNITNGTLPDARLSANIPRLNTANTFTGAITATTYYGDGSNLTGITGGASLTADQTFTGWNTFSNPLYLSYTSTGGRPLSFGQQAQDPVANSAGLKMNLYGNATMGALTYGIGVGPNNLWYHSPFDHKFYSNTYNLRMTIGVDGVAVPNRLGVGTSTPPNSGAVLQTTTLSASGQSTLANITANAAGVTNHIFQQGAAERLRVNSTGIKVTGAIETGGVVYPLTTIGGNHTVLQSEYLFMVNATAGNYTITMPQSAPVGQTYMFIVDPAHATNTVTWDAGSGGFMSMAYVVFDQYAALDVTTRRRYYQMVKHPGNVWYITTGQD